jgi:cytochrome c oxidase subunit I+III
VATRDAPRLLDATDTETLNRTWKSPPGFLGWFTHVNQRKVGKRFIVTSFVFFLLAGLLALVMRTQLAKPENNFLSPELYNQIFTMHGTTMMFIFAVPMVEGLGIYLMPLMIGTRDMCFPRLNAFGYYIFLIGGITFYAAFLLGVAPDAGWFNYVPIASEPWSPGKGIDIYTTVITFIEVSALVAAVELIVTIFKLRAPGMSLNRMPVFVWSILVTAFMIVFAMPGVVVSSVMLALDRSVDTVFFLSEKGGDPLLWQHLFWWFGHPEVYIILLPAFGVVSQIVTTFSRRPIFGYTAVVLSLVGTGIVSFGLWVHHMFTVGIPQLADSFFTAASIMIAIPTGVQIFSWIATLWGSRPVLKTPLLFVVGAIIIFVLGGISGVMVASVPFDTQVHDTFFVVAHFHYVLIGGMVFPMFGGFYYWFPKWTGRMLSEGLGKWNFWVMFLGFNVAFFPMHQLGFQGMPRRVYTYLDGLGWGGLNLLSTVGAFAFATGILIFLVNALWSRFFGERAGDNPWGADTLEWLATSPPQNYNFRHIPVVEGRGGLWDRSDPEAQPVVVGLRDDRREVLTTTVLDAAPEAVEILPGPSPWPFWAAVAASVGFIGYLFAQIFYVIGFFLTFFMLVGWLWPRDPKQQPASNEEAKR